jgi:hypothetical protein
MMYKVLVNYKCFSSSGDILRRIKESYYELPWPGLNIVLALLDQSLKTLAPHFHTWKPNG